MPSTERRAITRTHHDLWPEAMREEFRKVQFLDAVDVEEVDASSWQDIMNCFEGRYVKFI